MPELHVNSFRIGGDPEWALFDPTTNRQINFTSVSNEIGADHGGQVVEIRPQPSYTVAGFLKNVKKIVESPSLNSVRHLKWRSGAFVNLPDPSGRSGYDSYIAMGGHIHLEVPYSHDRGSIPAVSRELLMARMNAYDFVTQMMEEIDFLPKEECRLRRDRTGSYGHFGYPQNMHCVVDSATGQQRIEYRSPCSWMFNPRNAFFLITALKLATISPESVTKTVITGSADKIYAGFVKLFRNFQNVDNDSYIAANRICRSSSPDNLERLKAIVDVDFKPNWVDKKTTNMQPPA